MGGRHSSLDGALRNCHPAGIGQSEGEASSMVGWHSLIDWSGLRINLPMFGLIGYSAPNSELLAKSHFYLVHSVFVLGS